MIEITADVLGHTDAETGKPFVDIVLDRAEQKGTGRWTVQNALDLGVPITGIAEATMARALSGSVPQRDCPGQALAGTDEWNASNRDQFVEDATSSLRLQGGGLFPGLRPDRGRERRVRLGH